jgi:hypothetical protein
MVSKDWRLCSGANLPVDVVQKLENLTRLSEDLRLMTVQALVEVMRLADKHGVTEVADAAQLCGIQIGDVELPIVALKTAGSA